MRKPMARLAAAVMLLSATTFFALPATPAAAWMSDCSSFGGHDFHTARCLNGTGEVRAAAQCRGVTPVGVQIVWQNYGPWVSAGYTSEGDCFRWYYVYSVVESHRYETRN